MMFVIFVIKIILVCESETQTQQQSFRAVHVDLHAEALRWTGSAWGGNLCNVMSDMGNTEPDTTLIAIILHWSD